MGILHDFLLSDKTPIKNQLRSALHNFSHYYLDLLYRFQLNMLLQVGLSPNLEQGLCNTPPASCPENAECLNYILPQIENHRVM